MYSTKMTIEYS